MWVLSQRCFCLKCTINAHLKRCTHSSILNVNWFAAKHNSVEQRLCITCRSSACSSVLKASRSRIVEAYTNATYIRASWNRGWQALNWCPRRWFPAGASKNRFKLLWNNLAVCGPMSKSKIKQTRRPHVSVRRLLSGELNRFGYYYKRLCLRIEITTYIELHLLNLICTTAINLNGGTWFRFEITNTIDLWHVDLC